MPKNILSQIGDIFSLELGKIEYMLKVAGLNSVLWITALAILYPLFFSMLVQISFGVSPGFYLLLLITFSSLWRVLLL